MDFEQLRQLETIAREGTMSAAAQTLNISQPALTRSMQRLEQDLGAELFDRTGRRIALNATGDLVLERAVLILHEERRLRDAVAARIHRQRALSVGTVAPAPLIYLTTHLLSQAPDVLLSSRMTDARSVERGVSDGSFDLGISTAPSPLPALRSKPIMVEHLMVALPPGHRCTEATELPVEEFDGETFLLFKGIGRWRDFCARHLPHATFVVQEDRRILNELARSSEALMFATDEPSRPVEASGRVLVPLSDADATLNFYLLMRADATKEMQGLFESMGYWDGARERRAERELTEA